VGDAILKVAQKDEDAVEIGPMRLSDAVKLIKGPKGTQVFLTVRRVSGIIEEVVINRDVVELEESYAKSTIIQKMEKFMVSFSCLNFILISKIKKAEMLPAMSKKNWRPSKKEMLAAL
jgi:hypothetical protein